MAEAPSRKQMQELHLPINAQDREQAMIDELEKVSDLMTADQKKQECGQKLFHRRHRATFFTPARFAKGVGSS